MKICHMTSAHPQEDIRIFHKECVSLANAGYELYQISFGNNKSIGGVNLVGLGDEPKGRFNRMTGFAKSVYLAAKAIDADVYHFHDPELLPYGIKLKKQGKIVVFDSHEDVSAQIMDKPWIPGFFRKLVAKSYYLYETSIVKRIDAVVAATPHIAKSFEKRAKRVVVINNYPKLDDVIFQTKPFRDRDRVISYAGGLSEVRGERILVEAMKTVDGLLTIACDHAVERQGNINYIGRKDRAGVNELYGSSRAGIVIYQPADNHIDSQPIKLFEFMAAGLPVIASNFPLWKSIIEDNKCGICVNPCDPKSVSEACNLLLSSPEIAEEMGKRGREAVEKKYSWMSEERKLVDLYRDLEKNICN